MPRVGVAQKWEQSGGNSLPIRKRETEAQVSVQTNPLSQQILKGEALYPCRLVPIDTPHEGGDYSMQNVIFISRAV